MGRKMKKALKDCFEEGLLKKTEPNQKLSEQSILQAEHFLLEADKAIDAGLKDLALIALYNCLFHSARAILFRDGIKERSHYCLSKYIEEKYKEKEFFTLKQTIILDSLREKRNEIQYSVKKTKITENLDEIYNEAEEFLERTKEILKMQ
jgi:uncharacterized protein (UPF0332 family)